MPTAEDFRHELFQMMANAQKNGREFIEISARELHARVGPPLRRNYRMPNCCRVMKAQLATDYGDVIVNEPRGGQGPTFTIRYRLPRRKRVDL
jgi:5-methylcytosine-specific restriction protein A